MSILASLHHLAGRIYSYTDILKPFKIVYIMKQACQTALLFLVASPLFAQEVTLPDDSMRDAWSEEQEQFDSLSREPSYGYDKGIDGNYGSPAYPDNRAADRQSPGHDIELDKNDGIDLTEQPELDKR